MVPKLQVSSFPNRKGLRLGREAAIALSTVTSYPGSQSSDTITRTGSKDLCLQERAGEDAHWYVLRVSARHEKNVSRILCSLGYTAFLPLSTTTHSYGARVRQYDIPVFPGYVFCQVIPSTTRSIAQLPSVLDFVGFGGAPAIVPDSEIRSLRVVSLSRLPLQSVPYLEFGDTVRVTHGPLAGVTGLLLDRNINRSRIVISINLLRRSVLLDVGLVDVERIPTTQ